MNIFLKPFTLFFVCSIISMSSFANSEDQIRSFYENYFKTMTRIDMSFFKKSQSYDLGYTAFPPAKNYTLKNLKTLIFHHTRSHEGEPGHYRTKFLGADISLKKLYHLMKEANLKVLSVSELKNATERFLTNQKQLMNIGKSYPICFQNKAGSQTPNYCSPTYISYDAQTEIESLFVFQYDGNLSKVQLELRELNALRMATKILEDNTFLQNDIGGWSGNFFNSMRGNRSRTRCGNETLTYIFFIESLIEQGLIKTLFLKQSYRDITRRGIFSSKASHQAVLIKGLNTESEYVLDSWDEDGGSMAHITTKQVWRNSGWFQPYSDIVPGSLDYRP